MKKRERHGKANTKLYVIWCAIVQRCENPKNKDWVDYGARGIRMCDAWRNSFAAFEDYVGEQPAGMTLDRIRNEGHYEPGNVRWASWTEQANNRRPRTLGKNNKTGILGVYWRTRNRHWRVTIGIGGTQREIATTVDFFEACCLRKSAENRVRSLNSLKGN